MASPSSTVDLQGAAALLQVHENTVLKLIKSGALPAAKIGRAYVLVTRFVLDYIERQVAQQTAERIAKA